MVQRWSKFNTVNLFLLAKGALLSSCSHRFGLAPNYGCCTANFNQGWPKFLQHLVYEYANGTGLVVAMYGPAHIQHTLQSGQPVTLDMTTDYPFSSTVSLEVSSAGSLSLSLRIPSWTSGATVQINTNSPTQATPGNSSLPLVVPSSGEVALPGTLHQVSVTGHETITLRLPAALRVERRFNNSAAIHYG